MTFTRHRSASGMRSALEMGRDICTQFRSVQIFLFHGLKGSSARQDSNLQFSDLQARSEDGVAEEIPVTSGHQTSRMTPALSVAKITLSLAESVGEAVPIAGAPLKAAAGGILKILELFDVS